jgi:hypothetical protein
VVVVVVVVVVEVEAMIILHIQTNEVALQLFFKMPSTTADNSNPGM